MVYTHVAAAILAGAVAATGAWQVQNWRYENKIAQMKQAQAEAVAQATDKARAQERMVSIKYQGALNDARKRSVVLQNAADSARTELDRLRDIIATRGRDASGSAIAACSDAEAPVRAVLQQCLAEYEAMGRNADAHASDARTLIEAWPRN